MQKLGSLLFYYFIITLLCKAEKISNKRDKDYSDFEVNMEKVLTLQFD